MKDTLVFRKEWKDAMSGLPNEVRLEVYEAIIEYGTSGTHPSGLKQMAMLAFNFAKTTLDKDREKYEDTRKKRSEAGKKHKGNQYKNGTSVPFDEQMEQNGTNGTVSVSVSDSVNVSDSVSVSVNNIAPPTDTDTVFDFCVFNFGSYNKSDLEKSCKKFFNYYQERGWKNVNNWQEKLNMWIEDDIEGKKIKRSKKRVEVINGITYEDGIRIL
jgi:hypothetical protein